MIESKYSDEHELRDIIISNVIKHEIDSDTGEHTFEQENGTIVKIPVSAFNITAPKFTLEFDCTFTVTFFTD